MANSTYKRDFSDSAEGFRSEGQWQYADRVIVRHICDLAKTNLDGLVSLLRELPTTAKIESTDPRLLGAKLGTTQIPAFVEKIAAACDASGCHVREDVLLKPALRALHSVAYFATVDNDPLEVGMKAVGRYIASGRAFVFEYTSNPPGTNWKPPAMR